MEQTSGPVILLGGPTASGKSGLALDLAETFGGALVNADSMQVYRDLRVLTARPDEKDGGRCPHHLFGTMDASLRCSVGLWHEEAKAAALAAGQKSRLPVLVGGTGLYLDAFERGMSPIPDVPSRIRGRLSRRMTKEGPATLHEELSRRDPTLAATLAPGDTQRVQRALEVIEATGKPLSQWQQAPREGGWEGPVLRITLMPPRDALYARCEERFDAMLERGALEEVRRLVARDLDRSLPAMRALGVGELAAWDKGMLNRATAVARAKTATRRYAKRQGTWFRNQVEGGVTVEAFGFEEAAKTVFSAVERFLLTAKPTPA